jgi:hypothetical protein
MIQVLREEGEASSSRDFAAGPGRKWTVVIENAGELLSGTVSSEIIGIAKLEMRIPGLYSANAWLRI